MVKSSLVIQLTQRVHLVFINFRNYTLILKVKSLVDGFHILFCGDRFDLLDKISFMNHSRNHSINHKTYSKETSKIRSILIKFKKKFFSWPCFERAFIRWKSLCFLLLHLLAVKKFRWKITHGHKKHVFSNYFRYKYCFFAQHFTKTIVWNTKFVLFRQN